MAFERVRFAVACGWAAPGALALALSVSAQSKVTCDPDNGGLKLPQGFCALVAADGLGTARHLAVAPNGDVYVALQTRGGRGQSATGGGVVALRDADGDGKLEIKQAFGAEDDLPGLQAKCRRQLGERRLGEGGDVLQSRR